MITTKTDFREAAPAAGDLWMYKSITDPTASTIGGLGLSHFSATFHQQIVENPAIDCNIVPPRQGVTTRCNTIHSSVLSTAQESCLPTLTDRPCLGGGIRTE